LVALALLLAAPAGAQTLVELRGSNTKYRFVDVNHTFGSGLVLDALYVGVPGQDEFYLGAGFQWKAASWLTITPLVYGLRGAQNDETGVVTAACVVLETRPLKAVGFVARFVRVDGGIASYNFVDSLDVSHAFGKTWELGLSTTLYWPQTQGVVGPMLRRNDARGSWAFSLRGGSDTEARLTRVMTF
jgi:hypothetical protein